MLKGYTIPEGYTMEEIVSMAEQKLRDQRNKYNRTHPEIIEQQRIRTYINYLRKRGKLVLDASQLPALPWDEPQGLSILKAIRENVEGLHNE